MTTSDRRPTAMTPPIIAPSILAADLARLGEELAGVPSARWIHVDVMDGHFVPNLSFGLPVLEAVRRSTDRPADVHLMIEDPARWAPDYARAGAAIVTFHLEAVDGIEAAVSLARELRSLGSGAGITLKPGTPIAPILDVLEDFDLVLVMSVEPGFGGQSFMPDQLEKVRALRAAIDDAGLSTLVEIDGGIGAATIGEAAEAGADVFVAGSAVFGAEDADEAVRTLDGLVRDAR